MPTSFHGHDEPCDKGAMIETTDTGSCVNCGACAQVCYFKARKIDENGQLAVDREKCYGCGLCVDVCPTDSVKMVGRS